MEARARDAAWPQGHEPAVRPRAAHPRPRGLLNHLVPNPADEPYLAQIYAAPEDDAPRQVFADALSERGDPRGEFITLQLARARGSVTPAQLARERELAAPLEHRIAWARPVSKGGTCHLSRGFPDELMIEPKQFKGLLGHPAVSTLHTVTGFEFGIPDDDAKQFLLQPSAARLRSVFGLMKGVVESLEAPLAWPSVGLSFLPTREHREHLARVAELKVSMQFTALSAESFGGLTSLEKLTVGRVGVGALEPLTRLQHLEVSDWRSTNDWGKELASLPGLKQLSLSSTITAPRVRGLRIKKLGCWTSSEFEVDAVLGALPQLEELRLWCGTEAATKETLEKVLAAQRLTQLRFVGVGMFEFTRPRTPEASLEVRVGKETQLGYYARAMEAVPAGSVPKVVVRPRYEDPWSNAGPPPEGFAKFRAAAKMPVELTWY